MREPAAGSLRSSRACAHAGAGARKNARNVTRRTNLLVVIVSFHSAHVIHTHCCPEIVQRTDAQEDELPYWIPRPGVGLEYSRHEIGRARWLQAQRRPV